MANLPGNTSRFVRVDNVKLEDSVRTATFNSDAIKPNGGILGLWVEIASPSGTGEDLNVALEISPDGGTTWTQYPDSINADGVNSQAALPELTTADTNVEFWPNWCPTGGNCQVRATFTITGTSASFTITAYWISLTHSAGSVAG